MFMLSNVRTAVSIQVYQEFGFADEASHEWEGARYMRMHRPKKIIYVEEFFSRAEAVKRERTVKMFNHPQIKSKHHVEVEL